MEYFLKQFAVSEIIQFGKFFTNIFFCFFEAGSCVINSSFKWQKKTTDTWAAQGFICRLIRRARPALSVRLIISDIWSGISSRWKVERPGSSLGLTQDRHGLIKLTFTLFDLQGIFCSELQVWTRIKSFSAEMHKRPVCYACYVWHVISVV